jgi:hypothetical protein
MPPRRSRRAQTFPLTVSAVDDSNIALRVVIVVLGVLLLGAAFYYSAHHRGSGSAATARNRRRAAPRRTSIEVVRDAGYDHAALEQQMPLDDQRGLSVQDLVTSVVQWAKTWPGEPKPKNIITSFKED